MENWFTGLETNGIFETMGSRKSYCTQFGQKKGFYQRTIPQMLKRLKPDHLQIYTRTPELNLCERIFSLLENNSEKKNIS